MQGCAACIVPRNSLPNLVHGEKGTLTGYFYIRLGARWGASGGRLMRRKGE